MARCFIKERTFGGTIWELFNCHLATVSGIFLMSMWDFQQIVDHFQSIQDRLSHVSAKSQARQEERGEASSEERS